MHRRRTHFSPSWLYWRGCLWLLCQFLHSEHWIYGYWKSNILLLLKAKILIDRSNIQNTHHWTSQEASTSTKATWWGDMSYTCYEGIWNNPHEKKYWSNRVLEILIKSGSRNIDQIGFLKYWPNRVLEILTKSGSRNIDQIGF